MRRKASIQHRLGPQAQPARVKVHIESLSLEGVGHHDPATLRQGVEQSLQQSLARDLPSLFKGTKSSEYRSRAGGYITGSPHVNGSQLAAAIHRALNQ